MTQEHTANKVVMTNLHIRLMEKINAEIDSLSITQKQAAKTLGIGLAKMTKLKNMNSVFTLDELFRFLNLLCFDVDICVQRTVYYGPSRGRIYIDGELTDED